MTESMLSKKHNSELIEFDVRRKQQWRDLLKGHQERLENESNVAGFAETFAKERDDHNKKFEKEKKDLKDRQQKEIEEWKRNYDLNREDEEIEM